MSASSVDASLTDARDESDNELGDPSIDCGKTEYPSVVGSASASPLPPLKLNFPLAPGPKPYSPDAQRNAVIAAVKKQVEICHRSVDSNQAGRLWMVVGIGLKGEVVQVTATASGTLSHQLAKCVEGRVKKVKVDPPERGAYTESFPIVLRR